MSKTARMDRIKFLHRKVIWFHMKTYARYQQWVLIAKFRIQIVGIPLHHIRPKLFRPLDFPEKEKEVTISYLKKIWRNGHENEIWDETLQKQEESWEWILPIRAMVARYTAVAMLAKKTTAYP